MRLYSKDTFTRGRDRLQFLQDNTDEQKAGYADAGFPVYMIVLLNAAQDGVEQVEEYDAHRAEHAAEPRWLL